MKFFKLFLCLVFIVCIFGCGDYNPVTQEMVDAKEVVKVEDDFSWRKPYPTPRPKPKPE